MVNDDFDKKRRRVEKNADRRDRRAFASAADGYSHMDEAAAIRIIGELKRPASDASANAIFQYETVCAAFARHEHPDVRAALAGSKHVTDEVAAILSQDEDPIVRDALLNNGNDSIDSELSP